MGKKAAVKKKVVKKKRPKKKRVKQKHFDGMEPKSIPEIDKVASKYVDWRDERLEALQHEKQHKDKLLELMKKHKLKAYKFEGYKVTDEAVDETVKVKALKEDDD